MIIRKALPTDATGIAIAHEQTWQTTYRGVVPDSYLDSIDVEKWRERWQRDLSSLRHNQFVYVAENPENNQIAGFIWGGPERDDDATYDGELYAIYILAAYQKQGLGSRLVHALVQSLLEAGISSMRLWVIDANPGRRFYEALGGQPVKHNIFEIHDVAIAETSYGWTDIHSLLQSTHP